MQHIRENDADIGCKYYMQATLLMLNIWPSPLLLASKSISISLHYTTLWHCTKLVSFLSLFVSNVITISTPHILASVVTMVSTKAQFSALCTLSSVLLFHLFSSPSIHQISTPTSFTYKMLCNRSLPGWLPIFSYSTLLKRNLFLLHLNNNSLRLLLRSQPWFYFWRTPYLLGPNQWTF